jgi:hypothetical protein
MKKQMTRTEREAREENKFSSVQQCMALYHLDECFGLCIEQVVL